MAEVAGETMMTDFTQRTGSTCGRVEGAAAAAQFNGQPVESALSARFDILKPLGADERARYYLARERGFQGSLMIKVLAPHLARDLRQRELFHLESYAASKLAHFNIARTGETQELGGVYFCAIESKQDACALGDLLDRNGWLELDRAVEIADQIASALDHAHSLGVLHLQLQPESILVEPNGWVLVKDFGIESSAKSDWAHRERAGRLAAPYVSVEQMMGAKIDHRSDLYSLGVILYEMLTDRVPFDSDDDEYVRQKQLNYAPAPPHLISTDVPEAVSGVVMKLLEKDPNNRFDRAADFQTALYAALG